MNIQKTWLAAPLILICMGGEAAFAACNWQTQCNNGTCQRIPICDSLSEFAPSSRPNRLSPIPAPPPVASTNCRQQKVCDTYGNCTFRSLCR